MKTTVIQNVRELLFFHECVIIPDFGGFVLNYTPAKIDEKSGLFTPPGKDLVFNKNLINNDGLLINHISKNNDVNYLDAKSDVSGFVNSIKHELKHKGQVELAEIGSFYLKGQIISFKPQLRKNYNIDVYGMTSFSFPVLQKHEAIQEIEKRFKDRPSVKQVIKKRSAKRILIGIPLILALALFPFKTNVLDNYSSAGYNTSSNNNYQENITNPNSIEDVIQQMTQKENALMYVESENFTEKIEDELLDTSNKIVGEIIPEKISTPVQTNFEEVSEQIQADKKFHIIAGSFAEQKRAEDHCLKLKNKNLDAFILPKEKGRLRISLGGFDKKSDATAEVNKIQGHTDLSVWILTRN